ncbi:synaptic plasticity regulator PANTS-like isoform X1 [Rhopilema esculentum]|uniref:synaptic plasticity regulator PANTS-like isoform X1 n=1 Tax=Rhopilema esculentum TaxID=499914 RepID=UPI0031D9F001
MSILEEYDNVEEEKVKIPSCLSLFNEWRICSSSQRQFQHYYIYGKFDRCSDEQSNWTNCLIWKTQKKKEARDSILENVKRKEEEQNKKHSAPVWKFRRDPAQGWNSA